MRPHSETSTFLVVYSTYSKYISSISSEETFTATTCKFSVSKSFSDSCQPPVPPSCVGQQVLSPSCCKNHSLALKCSGCRGCNHGDHGHVAVASDEVTCSSTCHDGSESSERSSLSRPSPLPTLLSGSLSREQRTDFIWSVRHWSPNLLQAVHLI